MKRDPWGSPTDMTVLAEQAGVWADTPRQGVVEAVAAALDEWMSQPSTRYLDPNEVWLDAAEHLANAGLLDLGGDRA